MNYVSTIIKKMYYYPTEKVPADSRMESHRGFRLENHPSVPTVSFLDQFVQLLSESRSAFFVMMNSFNGDISSNSIFQVSILKLVSREESVSNENRPQILRWLTINTLLAHLKSRNVKFRGSDSVIEYLIEAEMRSCPSA